MKRFFKQPKESQNATSTTAQGQDSQILYIRVHRRSLVINPTGTVNPTTSNPSPSLPQPESSGHLYLIEGSIGDIKRYAGSHKLIGSSKLPIPSVDPSKGQQRSNLYPIQQAHPLIGITGTTEMPIGDKSCQVIPLLSGIYEFETTSPHHSV